jgi:hypothetical protein
MWMLAIDADLPLLFGLLALQTGLISQGALFTAFNTWTRNKTRSMAEILVEQGDLDATHRSLVEGLVAAHLKLHGGAAEKSLAAIPASRSVREELAGLNDPVLTFGLGRVGASPAPARSGPTPVAGASDATARTGNLDHWLADQNRRWRQGDHVRVEAYLELQPELREQPEALLDLIYNEFVLREQGGESPGPDEYVERFPALSGPIREQFEIHRMFASGSVRTVDGDPGASATFSVGTSSSSGLRFRLLRPHARGGLGAVFVARDTELNREVAVKQILDGYADDPVSRSRFVVEAEITGGLEHPGIVPVYGLGTYANGRPFYAMRLIKGESLKDAIAAFHADVSLKRDAGLRSLALRKLLRRFLDVCNAIDYAHSRGVASGHQAGKHHRGQARRDVGGGLGTGQVGGAIRSQRCHGRSNPGPEFVERQRRDGGRRVARYAAVHESGTSRRRARAARPRVGCV